MPRIFISIELPEDVRKIAEDHISKLKLAQGDVRATWVKPEKMHLTLRFLGDIDEAMLLNVNDAVARVANLITNFQLTLQNSGVFPNKKRPKVLWLGVHDDAGVLQKLSSELENRLEEIGFEIENRRFRPHLTIARLRAEKGARDLVERHLETVFERISFEVSEIAVVESRLEPTGSVYSRRFVAKTI